MKSVIKKSSVLSLTFLLCSCMVGPKYQRPPVIVPTQYKETCGKWKVAQPNDNCDRGQWWKVFNDPQLNALEDRLNICDQNIAEAIAQYGQARSLVDAARASYFPTIVTAVELNRQKQVSNGGVTTLGNATTVSTSGTNEPFTTHTLQLDATWEPDLWGSVDKIVIGWMVLSYNIPKTI